MSADVKKVEGPWKTKKKSLESEKEVEKCKDISKKSPNAENLAKCLKWRICQ